MKLFKQGDIVIFTYAVATELNGQRAVVIKCEDGEYSEGLIAPLVTVISNNQRYVVYCWRISKVQTEFNFNKGE